MQVYGDYKIASIFQVSFEYLQNLATFSSSFLAALFLSLSKILESPSQEKPLCVMSTTEWKPQQTCFTSVRLRTESQIVFNNN